MGRYDEALRRSDKRGKSIPTVPFEEEDLEYLAYLDLSNAYLQGLGTLLTDLDVFALTYPEAKRLRNYVASAATLAMGPGSEVFNLRNYYVLKLWPEPSEGREAQFEDDITLLRNEFLREVEGLYKAYKEKMMRLIRQHLA